MSANNGQASLPERLYKFQSLSTLSLANLKNRVLWFSRPARFNDPFDCRLRLDPAEVPDEELNELYQHYRTRLEHPDLLDEQYLVDGALSAKFKAEVLKGTQRAFSQRVLENSTNRGVCCLTEVVDDLLMWSHYTDGHRGFCLEFDTKYFPFNHALPVQYSDEVPTVSIARAILNPEENGFLQMITTKSRHWAYEREWRILHMSPDTSYTYPWQALTAVYLGAAMDYTHKEIIAMILEHAPTRLIEAGVSDRSFGLTFRPVQYTPFVYEPKSTNEPGTGGVDH